MYNLIDFAFASKKLELNINQIALAITNSSGLSGFIPTAIGSSTVGTAAKTVEILDEIQGKIQEAQSNINDQAKVLTAILYAVPEQLRFIPMSVSVRLSRHRYDQEGKLWDNGQAFLVAPFTDTSEPNWREWASNMSSRDTGFSR